MVGFRGHEQGVKVNLVVLKGAGHGGAEFLQPNRWKFIDAFLNENLSD